jgi:hypothetical protein
LLWCIYKYIIVYDTGITESTYFRVIRYFPRVISFPLIFFGLNCKVLNFITHVHSVLSQTLTTTLLNILQLCTSPTESVLYSTMFNGHFNSHHHFWHRFVTSITVTIWYGYWTLKKKWNKTRWGAIWYDINHFGSENENDAIWGVIWIWWESVGLWK